MKVPMIVRYPGSRLAGTIDDRLISFVDFAPTLLSQAGIEPPDYMDGQAFDGTYKVTNDRTYVHGAADRFDEHADMIRAVRNVQFKYLRNFN